MADNSATETGINADTPEISKGPEGDSRKSVLEAFNYAKNKFVQEIGTKPANELSEEEKEDLNSLNGAFITEEHREGADFTKQKFTYTNKITDPNGGPDIIQEEGVPVEGLIRFLEIKLIGLRNGREKDKVQKTLDILKRNNKTYEESFPDQKIDIQPGEVDNPTTFAWKRQEAKFISFDQRATGSEEADYDKGLKTLRRRRMLVVPAKETPKLKAEANISTSQTEPDQGNRNSHNTIEAAEEEELSEDTSTTTSGENEEDQGTVEENLNLGIPVDRRVGDVEEPEEHERVSVDFINETNAIAQETTLQAQKEVNERLSKGKLWEIWRWPAKLALNLSKGGIESKTQEKLQRAANKNNVLFSTVNLTTGAAATINQLSEKSDEFRKAELERFRKGRITEGTGPNGQIIETRRLIDGKLKTEIINRIFKPILHPDQDTYKDKDGNPDPITGTPTEQANAIRRRLSAFVKDNLTDTQVQEIFGVNANDYGYVAEAFATDILEKAQVLQGKMTQHKLSLDDYSAYIDLHFGLSRGLYNTDTRSMTDKTVAWARRRQNEHLTRGVQEASRVTGWVWNPAVVGISTSLATEGLLKAFGAGSRVAGITGPLAGLMGGAGVAGLRRYFEIGGHRKMQNAEQAMGEEIASKQHSRRLLGKLYEKTAGMYRREDLLQFRYDSVKVSELINGTNGQEISDPSIPNNPQAKRKLESVDQLIAQNNREDMARRMEELRTRIRRGLTNGQDLITYSDKTKVAAEKNQLYDEADKLEAALRVNGTDFDLLTQAANQYWQDTFSQDQQRKDHDFNVYRWKQTAGAAAMGGTMGFLAGVGVQQGAAEVARHFTGAANIPVVGGMFKPGQTLFEKGENLVGSAIGHSEWGTGPASTDSLAGLYKNGGRVDLGEKVTAKVNPDHTVSLLNRDTGQPIPNQPPLFNEANGHLVTTGKVDALPEGMRSWAHTETDLHSVHKQIIDAAASGHLQTVHVGNANIEILGSNARILIGNETVPAAIGSIGSDGTLHLSSYSVNALRHTGGELLDHGFPDSQIIKNPSVLDEVREVFNQPNANPTTVNIPGVGDATITPSSGKILINPSSGTLTGAEIRGVFNPNNGSFHLNLPPNSNLNLQEIQQTLEHAGFTGVKVEDMTGGTTTENVTEHFRKIGQVENAHREFWHDNDTPMHKLPDGRMVDADGKELQFYHHLNKNGTIVLDMSQMVSKMTPQGGVNWDFTVDRQYNHVMNDIITNADGSRTYNNFEFLITPDNAADNAREVIQVTVDSNGFAHIPKDSELAQFFNTTNGKPEQLARFIEVAHLEKDASGNLLNRTILSTSVGDGIDKINVTTPGIHTLNAVLPDTHTYNLDLIPPHATELIPPVLEPPPFIPIPFERMHPLEPLENGGGVYYNLPITEERRRLFEQNRSRTLIANPNAVLNPQVEIPQYLQRQTPEYLQEISQLAEQIQTPISPSLRAVVCIPVAGHEEGEHIYETLENYTYQDAPKNQYEILLFVNHPEDTKLDKTVEETRRFQSDHPDMSVRMVYKQLSRSQAKMAVIRKYLNDVALKRSEQIINDGRDLILISNDADLKGVAPEYISNFITKFDQNPRLDAQVGQIDWDPASYVEYPAIHAGTRLFQYLNTILWNGKPGNRPSSGTSTAIKASIYAGVGGYQINDMPGAEDVILGQAIRTARNSSNTIGYAGARVSRLYTSSRRAVDAWASGFAPIEQWDRNWGVINEQIRRLRLGQHQNVDYDNPAILGQLKNDLEKIIGRTLTYYADVDNNLESPIFKRAVGLLGVSYKQNPTGGIEITNMSKLIKGIKRYQQRGLILQQVKSGKLPISSLTQFEEELQPITIPGVPIQSNTAPANTTLPSTSTISEVLQSPRTTQNINHELISPEDGEQILSRTEIHGFPFHGRKLTTEDLKNLDLVPTYKTTIEGSTVWFSPAYYSDNNGRVAVVGYVQDKNGQMVARTFYRSDSQGIWRYLPNYRLNKVGNINWYAKGYGEESIQLPIELQKALAEITKDKTGIFNISDRELVFAGTARNLNVPGTLYIEVHSVPQKLPGNFYEADPKKKISPAEIRFTNQDDTPDFTKSLSSWTQETDLYGPVTIEVFSSRNGKLKYMFCRDGKDRAWIGGIENNSPMQSVGLRQDWVTAGDLTTPGYEYPAQTAGYGNPADRKGTYVDMFENYLKHVPIIQEYLQSKKPPQPSSPSTHEAIGITDEDIAKASITDQELSDTERWANNYTLGYVDLYNRSPEEKRRILELFARRVREQERLLESRYTATLPPISPTGTEGTHWEKQTNPGMLTCQFASSINALRALGIYDPQRHREKKFIEVLGGEEYVRNHPRGAGTHDLDDAFHKLAPEASIHRSNSLFEILEAVEKGAAAIVELGPGHVGTILPGNRVLRSSNGQLQVQVLDPLSGIRIVPIDYLVKSNITLAGLPGASPGIIVGKAP